MCKRVLSMVLCVVMLFALSLSCVAVSAEEAVSFTLSATDAVVGETMSVTIILSNGSRFTNATMYLHYDTSAVSFVKSTAGAIAAPASSMFDFTAWPEKGYVRGIYATVLPITQGGEFFVFEFTVLEDKPAVFSLTFDECVGENVSGQLFDLTYTTVGVTANDDDTVNGDPVVGPTITPVVTTTTALSGGTLPTQPPQQEGTTPSKEDVTTPSNNVTVSDDPQSPTRTTAAVEQNDQPADDGISPIVWVCIVVGGLAVGVTVVAILLKKNK